MRWVALVLSLAILMAACGDDASPGNTNAKSDRARQPVDYPATTTGLEDLIATLIDAVRSKRDDQVAALTARLELPEHARWFASTFGDEPGAALSRDYAAVEGQFEQLARVLDGLIAAEQTQISVERFERAGDPAATGYQNLALAAMKRPSALYSVRLTSGENDDGFHIWSFVHEDGTFRWIGKLTGLRDGPAADPDLLELRTSAASAAAP